MSNSPSVLKLLIVLRQYAALMSKACLIVSWINGCQGDGLAWIKLLGKELADTGVRVNCVTPAAVKTAIFDQMTPEHIQFMLSKIPMACFGEP